MLRLSVENDFKDRHDTRSHFLSSSLSGLAAFSRSRVKESGAEEEESRESMPETSRSNAEDEGARCESARAWCRRFKRTALLLTHLPYP